MAGRHRSKGIWLLCALGMVLGVVAQGYVVFLAYDEPPALLARLKCVFAPVLIEAVVMVAGIGAYLVLHVQSHHPASPIRRERAENVKRVEDDWNGKLGSKRR